MEDMRGVRFQRKVKAAIYYVPTFAKEILITQEIRHPPVPSVKTDDLRVDKALGLVNGEVDDDQFEAVLDRAPLHDDDVFMGLVGAPCREGG